MYHYEPLDKQEVRLLRPLERLGSESLDFSIERHHRERLPSFVALSYTWGDDAPRHPVRLNGKRFWVRRNLLAFFERAVEHPEWDLMWVDALCIDQSNIQERNEQVSSMAGLYKQAERVVAWLGEPQGNTRSLTPSRSLLPLELGIGRADSTAPEHLAKLDLLDIVNKPYWKRRWIVQELGSADDARILLLHGNHLIEMCHLRQTFRQSLDSLGSVERDLDAFTRLRPSFASPFLRGPTVTDQTTLVGLLTSYANCDCSDPRDLAFSLLGLLTDEHRTELGRYLPDYSLTHDEVAALVLAFMVRSDEDLSLYLDAVLYSLGLPWEDLDRLERVWTATAELFYNSDFCPETTYDAENLRRVDVSFRTELKQDREDLSTVQICSGTFGGRVFSPAGS